MLPLALGSHGESLLLSLGPVFKSPRRHLHHHVFRRTIALSCLRNGMNIYVLTRPMGHADIIILRQYLPLDEDDLQDANGRYGTVDHLLG